jgi:hypothetical protein
MQFFGGTYSDYRSLGVREYFDAALKSANKRGEILTNLLRDAVRQNLQNQIKVTDRLSDKLLN